MVFVVGPILRVELLEKDGEFAAVNLFRLLFIIVAIAVGIVASVMVARSLGRSIDRRIRSPP